MHQTIIKVIKEDDAAVFESRVNEFLKPPSDLDGYSQWWHLRSSGFNLNQWWAIFEKWTRDSLVSYLEESGLEAKRN